MLPAIFSSGWIVSAITAIGAGLIAAWNFAKDFPWRKFFAWSVVAGVAYYFFGLLWYGFKAALVALRWLASSGNFASSTSPESGLLGTHINLSAFWDILNGYLPDFWRYIMYFFALDWAIFVGINMLHMYVIGVIVDRLISSLSKAIHAVFNNL